ncbi:Permeases of the major facilitator superfamily [[Actinomadura] parvosata subsp. kistnae]|uniref:Putative proline/betaine transporter n=1 Tax=[Actinomadura] parvosata subsp. kistnae TaxID=1909395 RepID=A0A1U9ZRA2_9ACTN|nr:MFS transporter [Nonomuraea sp. ATCC 55076]AQZ60474.1 MFS transporter [Nonomuraea sp. ATCC 55076]SPL90981.1 Permeases of the major facilitator superfamily [Actinomadura parvosata subsp. kistnae]
MTTSPQIAAPPSRSRIAAASLIGTAIEFYDFYIYGTAAALVLNTAFFPKMDSVAGTLASFSTFAVAFISRPLGSAVFGHWGDRVGRKSMLVVSLLVMGLSTVLIGLLPGYATMGVLAPVLLVLLRFTQGIGLGGEWGGAALLATEHAPPGKRGLYAMFPQLGPSAGFIVANGLFLILGAALSDGQFESWGWRLPFVASLLLVIVGLYVRLKISETPVFQAAMEERRIAKVPFAGLMRHQWRRVLLGAGAMTVAYTLFYTATTYCLAYGTDTLEIPRTTMLALTMVGVVFMAAGTVASAMVSDRLGRRRTLIWGTAVAVAWGLVMFPLMETRSIFLVGLALAGALALMGLIFGPMGAYLPELFRTEYRYSGASVAYSLGGVLGGAVPPLVATGMQAGGLGVMAIGGYVSAMALLSLLCLLALPETGDRAL